MKNLNNDLLQNFTYELLYPYGSELALKVVDQ